MTKATQSGKQSLSTTVADYTKHACGYGAPKSISEFSEPGLYTKNPRRVALATLDRMKRLEEIGHKFGDALTSVHLDSASNHYTWGTDSVSCDVVDGYRYKIIFSNKKQEFAIPDWRAAIS